jgi:glycosyltransferase involved in cell wall biosynthesis
MRLVMIAPFAWSPKGTVSARAFLMARALVTRGHRVTMLIPPYDHPAHAGFEAEREGVRLVNMPFPTWGDSLRAKLVVPMSMARRVRRERPDLVHVFKPVGYAGLAAMYLRRLAPHLPLVLDSDDWEGRGGWADVAGYPPLWRLFLSWQEEWLLRRAHGITAASSVLQARTWGLGVDAQRVVHVPNGPADFWRQNQDVSAAAQDRIRQKLEIGAAPFGVYVGHISYGSEVNLALEALASVHAEIPEFRIVIIGSGDGMQALRAQASRLDVAQHVVFTGRVEPPQTAVHLAAAAVALYPYRDSLVNRAKSPSKITAYMAMAKPIVASRVGEIVTYLAEGRAGLLVEPGNSSAFAAGVVQLLRDPGLAAALGRRARERIWADYDWMRLVERVEKVYALARQGA